jgi:hypothetical protein
VESGKSELSSKKVLLQRLKDERAAWEIVLEAIPENQVLTPNLVGEWSVKDVIAHITSYELYLTDRLREIANRESYKGAETPDELETFLERFGYPDFGSPLLDDDEPNAWVVEHSREKSLETVRAESQREFQSLVEAVEALSDEQVDDTVETWIASNTWEHYDYHTADLSAALS